MQFMTGLSHFSFKLDGLQSCFEIVLGQIVFIVIFTGLL